MSHGAWTQSFNRGFEGKGFPCYLAGFGNWQRWRESSVWDWWRSTKPSRECPRRVSPRQTAMVVCRTKPAIRMRTLRLIRWHQRTPRRPFPRRLRTSPTPSRKIRLARRVSQTSHPPDAARLSQLLLYQMRRTTSPIRSNQTRRSNRRSRLRCARDQASISAVTRRIRGNRRPFKIRTPPHRPASLRRSRSHCPRNWTRSIKAA